MRISFEKWEDFLTEFRKVYNISDRKYGCRVQFSFGQQFRNVGGRQPGNAYIRDFEIRGVEFSR